MYITMAQASSDPGFTSLRGRPGRRSVKISTRDPCQTNCLFEVEMSERPEMITASCVPGGTTEVYESLSGSASNSARSSGSSAADVILPPRNWGPPTPYFFMQEVYHKKLSRPAWSEAKKKISHARADCARRCCRGCGHGDS